MTNFFLLVLGDVHLCFDKVVKGTNDYPLVMMGAMELFGQLCFDG
jgi:hypothetical protein